MTHIKYHTEAIVLGGVSSQEASKFLELLTRDFGLIYAYARGVREISSKLRYSLQDFSHSHIDLVESVYGWKITSAQYITNFISEQNAAELGHIKMATQIAVLLKRLMKGEEKNETLFTHVRDGFVFLKQNRLTDLELKNFEALLVMRILHDLGYWGEHKEHSYFLDDSSSFQILLPKMEQKKSLVIREINKSLKETQL
ncbi:MAG: recombination protein O N-terminal domain-containing protein [bacterium]|nr:recombination protein O N-terminal domain-containing protein [bacterium]